MASLPAAQKKIPSIPLHRTTVSHIPAPHRRSRGPAPRNRASNSRCLSQQRTRDHRVTPDCLWYPRSQRRGFLGLQVGTSGRPGAPAHSVNTTACCQGTTRAIRNTSGRHSESAALQGLSAATASAERVSSRRMHSTHFPSGESEGRLPYPSLTAADPWFSAARSRRCGLAIGEFRKKQTPSRHWRSHKEGCVQPGEIAFVPR